MRRWQTDTYNVSIAFHSAFENKVGLQKWLTRGTAFKLEILGGKGTAKALCKRGDILCTTLSGAEKASWFLGCYNIRELQGNTRV